MNRIHVTAVALVLGVSAVLGVAAATRTAGLRAPTAAATTDSAAIAARTRRLDRAQASIRRALRDRPPALPAVPGAARSAGPAPRVVYQRPAPIVLAKHGFRHDSEEFEEEDEEESDD